MSDLFEQHRCWASAPAAHLWGQHRHRCAYIADDHTLHMCAGCHELYEADRPGGGR